MCVFELLQDQLFGLGMAVRESNCCARTILGLFGFISAAGRVGSSEWGVLKSITFQRCKPIQVWASVYSHCLLDLYWEMFLTELLFCECFKWEEEAECITWTFSILNKISLLRSEAQFSKGRFLL